jgi:hypothetical protein
MPITGNQSKLQIGVQANWSTAVAPSKAISFTKEDMKYSPGYIQADALVGRKMAGQMHISNVKIEGSVSLIAYPDEIGLLVSAVMGAEASAAAVSGSAVYDHVFTPMSAVAASSLPKLTIVVDRIAAVKGYVGCKLDSMTLEAKSKDYLRATFAVIGQDEATSSTGALATSTKTPFMFHHGAVTVDGTPYTEVTSFRLNYKNNLENDLFTLGSGLKMVEVEPQFRDVTVDLDVLYSTTTDTTRTSKFVGGATCALVLTFTSDQEILTGKYYTLTISIPLAYITTADPAVSGPDRIKQTFACRASEDATNQGITITLRDGQAAKYIT